MSHIDCYQRLLRFSNPNAFRYVLYIEQSSSEYVGKRQQEGEMHFKFFPETLFRINF